MPEGRSFARASIGGNPVGRPRTAPPDPSRAASALIAAHRWQAKRAAAIGSGGPVQRSLQSAGELSAARGAQRADRRFEGEESLGRRIRSSAENPWA